jgi:hypothetical protein
MIDPLSLFIGFFLLVAIVRNKELSKEDKDGDYNDVFIFFSIFVLFLVLGGLNFLLPSRMGSVPNQSFLLPFQICLATVAVTTKGQIKMISLTATLAVFAYILLGSFA